MLKINTRGEFEELLERIKILLEKYENNISRNNKYTLFLANGDVINYSVHENNIPHLLGVNTNFLMDNKIVKSKEAYEALKEMIENSYSVFNSVQKINAFGSLFSRYIDDKLEVFEKQINRPVINEVEFVCKYDRTKNYTQKEVDGYNANYYIGTKNENGEIILLGLICMTEQYESTNYIPQTSRVIKDENELTEFLKGQEITYISAINTSNNLSGYTNNFVVRNIDTFRLLERLYSYQSMVSAIPNTIKNHNYHLKLLSKTITERQTHRADTSNIYEKINYGLCNKKIIELTEEDEEILDVTIINLIKEHNDIVMSDRVDSYSKGKYSELKDDRDKCRQELENLKIEFQKLRDENEQLSKELTDQKERNDNLQQYEEKYKDLANSIQSLVRKL